MSSSVSWCFVSDGPGNVVAKPRVPPLGYPGTGASEAEIFGRSGLRPRVKRSHSSNAVFSGGCRLFRAGHRVMVSKPEPLDLAFDLLPFPSWTLEGDAVAALKVSQQFVVSQEPIIDVFHDQHALTACVQNVVGGIARLHGSRRGS